MIETIKFSDIKPIGNFKLVLEKFPVLQVDIEQNNHEFIIQRQTAHRLSDYRIIMAGGVFLLYKTNIMN